MDAFNCYCMRPCGELKFQPKDVYEAIAFGVWDFLKSNHVNPLAGLRAEKDYSERMDKLIAQILDAYRAKSNVQTNAIYCANSVSAFFTELGIDIYGNMPSMEVVKRFIKLAQYIERVINNFQSRQ